MTPWTVAAFLNCDNLETSPLQKPDYQTSYYELSEVVKKYGGQLFIACGQDSYLGNGKFSHGWLITDLGQYQEIAQPIADVIYDKGNFKGDNTVPILNDPELSHLCKDKYLMYETFTEFCPKTILAKNNEEFLAALEKINTPLVVVKPVKGAEGKDVFILPKNQIKQQEINFPVIVQEFIDTSSGIPGITEGMHDLRIIIHNGEVLVSYIRTPPHGKMTANVAQGGKLIVVPINKIPTKVIEIVHAIDKKLNQFNPRLYSIDIGVTKNKPFLIEMNSELGLTPNQTGPQFIEMKERLAQTFQKLSQQK